MTDWLLPGWAKRLETVQQKSEILWPAPLARHFLAQQLQLVQTPDEARRLVQAAYEFPISHIGWDTEYRFRQDQPVRLPRGQRSGMQRYQRGNRSTR